MTFEDDTEGIATRHEIGVSNLLWGNDYPHHDSIWPNSRPILDDILAGVPGDEREAMVWGNVMDLYEIDQDLLPSPA